MYRDDDYRIYDFGDDAEQGGSGDEYSQTNASSGEEGGSAQENSGSDARDSGPEYTGQADVPADEMQQDPQMTTYRYTRIPYGEERIDGGTPFGTSEGDSAPYDSVSYADNTSDSAEQAQTDRTVYESDAAQANPSQPDGVSGDRKKQKKQKKQKKPRSAGKKAALFIGKAVAAALIFGVVAALTFSGVTGLLGGSTGSSASDITEALVSSASGDSSSSITVGTATALDVSDVVEEAMPSIVSVTSIYTYTSSGSMFGQGTTTEATSVGSGIIVAQTDETLYIVTNNHVVEDADSVTVTFVDDAEVTAEIKGTDSGNDLAVLSVSISDMSADTFSAISVATLGDSDELEVGETTIAIGNALGYGQSVTTGIVSALNREVTIDNVTSSLIQTDAAINPGNSGGALLNAAGEVIGINSAKYADTDVEGMGYAIPINTAIPIINELIEQEKVDESEAAYLGISGVDVSDDVASTYQMPTGVYVVQVVSGSAAEAAGIQSGDIITGFDGKSIGSMEELQELMTYYAAGTTVDVTVQRANNGVYEEITISVTLGSKNE